MEQMETYVAQNSSYKQQNVLWRVDEMKVFIKMYLAEFLQLDGELNWLWRWIQSKRTLEDSLIKQYLSVLLLRLWIWCSKVKRSADAHWPLCRESEASVCPAALGECRSIVTAVRRPGQETLALYLLTRRVIGITLWKITTFMPDIPWCYVTTGGQYPLDDRLFQIMIEPLEI